jgi:archaellum component FlaC
MSNIENLVLEHLKKMQAEMTGIRQDTTEIKSRLGSIENRHIYDRLAERVERLERRLEVTS